MRTQRERREQVAEDERGEHQERERRAERPVADPGERRLDPDAEQRAVVPPRNCGVT